MTGMVFTQSFGTVLNSLIDERSRVVGGTNASPYSELEFAEKYAPSLSAYIDRICSNRNIQVI
jgi:hypothetical protein